MLRKPDNPRRGFRYADTAILLSTISASIAVVLMDTNLHEQLADIRPVTRATKQLSTARLKNARSHYEGTHHSALLLLDPNCKELPSAVLEDSVLQPIDKLVLLIVMKIVRRSGDNAFLPTLVQLAKMANVASPDTVWRALLILRCWRWLTACQRMWCKSGFEPSAYVANAEPLPLADTLFLDPNYVECLRKCSGHAHARIREVANDILSQLPKEIRNKPAERPTMFDAKI